MGDVSLAVAAIDESGSVQRHTERRHLEQMSRRDSVRVCGAPGRCQRHRRTRLQGLARPRSARCLVRPCPRRIPTESWGPKKCGARGTARASVTWKRR